MRKILSIVVCVFALSFVCLTVYAHPGRTDSNGGHTDHSTGEYHYHHGYAAHQHTDLDGDGIPDCPYDYDDKTGQNSGSSSTGIEYEAAPTVPNKQPEYITVVQTKEVPVEVIPKWVFYGFGVCATAIMLMYLLAYSRKKEIVRLSAQLEQQNNDYEKKIKETINTMEGRISTAENRNRNELAQARNEYHALRQKVMEADREREKRIEEYRIKLEPTLSDEIVADLGNDYLLILSSAPDGVTFDSLGLPHKIEKGTDIYVFYISSTGKYHRRSCYHARYCKQIHALEIQSHPLQYSACQTCLPELPDLKWFEKYCNYKEFLERKNRKEN